MHQSRTTVIAAELRTPRAELGSREGMDAWIDMYHAVRSLARGTYACFDRQRVGHAGGNNLRHLVRTSRRDVARDHVCAVPHDEHSVEFCLSYRSRRGQHGFQSLVVLGGDKGVGRQRCVEHAWALRERIREREPRLTLGGGRIRTAMSRSSSDMTDDSFNAILTQQMSAT